MQRALALAGGHHPHPNPRVGAVVVRDGVIVGEGFHVGPGHDHAEVAALNQAGESAVGSTVYVTLEPCSHTGLTPPCSDALIAARVASVVVAAIDPDPRVAGTGVGALRGAGIEVTIATDQTEGRAVDRAYFHHRETGFPLVTLKYAMTLDGAVAALDGTSKWITNTAAREDAHGLRAAADAVVVGSGTLRVDDPRLDVRLSTYQGAQPRAVIIAGAGDLPTTSAIWDREPIVISAFERSLPSGELIEVAGAAGRPDPRASCVALADAGLLDLLVEGGPTLARSWLDSGVVSRGVVYIGSQIAGGGGMSPIAGAFATFDDSIQVSISGVHTLDGDVRVDFEVQ
ncbi:MAG: bifunctional diaminohydroxyphosphoribosylaminopyrimidine deaminase/5-amino-6-(5-phosphoribosylamino)uracil reductase RibD [Actinomycetota bacterium]|nr:bifunctional diaminohydroxyphosphoribosylaminopyrimidine deaminase/5-amino-6-(5-phosphoribosylamino)uracil reductase RibD [Actinomycetota bacterium]